jgi:hypothetical protein
MKGTSMMNEATIGELTALIAVVGSVSAAYGKALGPAQMQLVQWVIDALRIERRFRGLINLAVGLLLALALSRLTAWTIGDPRLPAIGLLAGIIASVEAARTHDIQENRSTRASA